MYRILHHRRIFQLNLNLIVNFWIRCYKTYLFCCHGADNFGGGKVRASAASLAKGTCGATTVEQLLLKLNTCSRPIYQYDRVSQKSDYQNAPGQALTSTRYPTRPELFFCYANPTQTIFQNFRV